MRKHTITAYGPALRFGSPSYLTSRLGNGELVMLVTTTYVTGNSRSPFAQTQGILRDTICFGQAGSSRGSTNNSNRAAGISNLFRDVDLSQTAVPAVSTLQSELISDVQTVPSRALIPHDVVRVSLGVSNVVSTAISGLLAVAGIPERTAIEYGAPSWVSAFNDEPLSDLVRNLGLVPSGRGVLTITDAQAISKFMVQGQNVTDFGTLEELHQSPIEDGITGTETFVGPGGSELTYPQLLTTVSNSGGSASRWYDTYVVGDITSRAAILTPTTIVVDVLANTTVSDALLSARNGDRGATPFVKYLFLNTLQRFPAYMSTSLASSILTSGAESDRQQINFICDAYSQSDPLGEFLRTMSVYVKNQASLSQPADIGMSPSEARLATIGLRIIEALNREQAKFTTVEARRQLTGREILATEIRFTQWRNLVYTRFPLARILTFSIADVPPALFARLRQQIGADPAVAVRAKALAVRAYRVIEYLRWCQTHVSGQNVHAWVPLNQVTSVQNDTPSPSA